ncbi:MAG TPA: hypothetical protein GXZ23_07580 [Clostridiales bacterium]|nr:hypothetical protein [Clostridiales bacterium]
MKKAICIVLSIVLAFSVCVVTVGAAGENEYDGTPVIMVAGYSSSPLFMFNEDGTSEKVWGLDFNEVGGAVSDNAGPLLCGLGEWIVKDPERLAGIVGTYISENIGIIACNPDGTSVNNVRTPYCSPEYCDIDKCYAPYLMDNENGDTMPEAVIAGELAEICGWENIWASNVDFRKGAEYCADTLNCFIETVCEKTGKEQVNICAVSHGGQVVSVYLNLYGDKGRVKNANLIVPAICGASLAADAFAKRIELDELTLIYFLEHGFIWEEDYHWLVKAEKLGFLDDFIAALIPYIYDVILYWTSMWDFVPVELYEEYKARLLDPVESAELIAVSDRMHYEIMPTMTERFNELKANGTNITIIAGYNIHSVAGYDMSGDAIITANCSTGAKVADWGYRFSDGYEQVGTVCNEHYHVSPDMCIDLSCGYLPDATWAVDGLYHGMVLNDAFTHSLFKKCVFGKISTVFDDKSFPQFHATTNRSKAVFAQFNNSVEGFLNSDDTKLIIRNLSQNYDMRILSVDVRGADFVFSRIPCAKYLKTNETIELDILGEIPQVSRKNIEITVNYTMVGSPTPLGTRTFDFMIMNGVNVEFDEENPLTPTHFPSYFEAEYNENLANLLDILGIKQLIAMIFNMFKTIIYNFQKLAVFYKAV